MVEHTLFFCSRRGKIVKVAVKHLYSALGNLVVGWVRGRGVIKCRRSFAIPKDPSLAHVACSIATWMSTKWFFHFAHVFSVLVSLSHFSRAVGKLLLAKMELVAFSVSYSSRMGSNVREDFFSLT